MIREEYKELVNKHLPKEKKFENAIIAFLTGGVLAIFSELLSNFLCFTFEISKMESYSVVCLIMIFLTCLFTSLGFFDNLVTKFKCGLIIPTTGFAHSVQASAIEYKKDGMITGIGANIFKLAGSVILYGIISSFFLCVIKGILWLV